MGVLIVWMLWFIEILFMLIILLNFLIAIISQSYEGVMSTSLTNKNIHRAEVVWEAVCAQGGEGDRQWDSLA